MILTNRISTGLNTVQSRDRGSGGAWNPNGRTFCLLENIDQDRRTVGSARNVQISYSTTASPTTARARSRARWPRVAKFAGYQFAVGFYVAERECVTKQQKPATTTDHRQLIIRGSPLIKISRLTESLWLSSKTLHCVDLLATIIGIPSSKEP